MTTWFGVSMDTTLLLIAWLPLLLPVFYWLMDKKTHSQLVSNPTTHHDIPYSPLNSPLPEQPVRLTQKEKIILIWYNMSLALSIYAATFVKIFLPQAVLTTVVFPDVPFRPRDHYQYYVLTLIAGELLGKSYGFVVLFLKCRLPQYTKHTWVFASFIVTFLIFLLCEAWFRFPRHFVIVIVICFVVGVFYGVVFDFTFAAAYGEPMSLSKKFSRAFLMFPFSLGSLCACSMGMYIEPLLEQRCVYVTTNITQCMTRIMR